MGVMCSMAVLAIFELGKMSRQLVLIPERHAINEWIANRLDDASDINWNDASHASTFWLM